MPRGLGPLQKKLLLLLAMMPALGLAYTPRQRAKVFQSFDKEWEKINDTALTRAIQSLYKNRLIDIQETKEGKIKIILLDNGKRKTLEYKLEEIQLIKPKHWDKKWRMVIFDIPDVKKKIREAFRAHLKRLGFYQYQKSVFIHPYPCINEIDFLVEFYKIRPFIRQLVIESIDNDFHLREIFIKLV